VTCFLQHQSRAFHLRSNATQKQSTHGPQSSASIHTSSQSCLVRFRFPATSMQSKSIFCYCRRLTFFSARLTFFPATSIQKQIGLRKIDSCTNPMEPSLPQCLSPHPIPPPMIQKQTDHVRQGNPCRPILHSDPRTPQNPPRPQTTQQPTNTHPTPTAPIIHRVATWDESLTVVLRDLAPNCYNDLGELALCSRQGFVLDRSPDTNKNPNKHT